MYPGGERCAHHHGDAPRPSLHVQVEEHATSSMESLVDPTDRPSPTCCVASAACVPHGLARRTTSACSSPLHPRAFAGLRSRRRPPGERGRCRPRRPRGPRLGLSHSCTAARAPTAPAPTTSTRIRRIHSKLGSRPCRPAGAGCLPSLATAARPRTPPPAPGRRGHGATGPSGISSGSGGGARKDRAATSSLSGIVTPVAIG